jgi:SSS family solute:Na+ symporter
MERSGVLGERAEGFALPGRIERPVWAWLVLGGLLFTAAAVLQVPGNPLMNRGDRYHRMVSTVLAHAAVLVGLLGIWPCRHRWLAVAAAGAARARWAAIVAAAVLPQLAVVLTASLWPAYGRALTREWGPLEPLSVAGYAVSAWLALEIARTRARRGIDGRPWRLVAAVCVLLALEEMDYLGIVGSLVGRVGGVYVGTLHDLLNLAAHRPALLLPLGLAAAAALAALWRTGCLTAAFLREELGAGSSLPVYLGLAALGLAEVADIQGDVLTALGGVFRYPVEEPLELLGAVLLTSGIFLKYVRDRRR